MSGSTAAVFPGRNGHTDEPYEEEEKELPAALVAEHARIRAGINARLAALQAEAKASRSASAVKGPQLTKTQKKAAASAKRKATLAAKAAAAAEEEEEEEEEPVAAAVPKSSANYVAAAAARYAASGLPAAAKKGSVRFLNMAYTRNVNRRDGRVPISDRSTRKSTAGKPVVPDVNIRRSRHAGDVSALFAKMSSWAVTRDPGYLTKILLHLKTDPHYLDAHLTAKEKEVLETPGVLAHLQKQAAMVDKE